jgi:hypothetical protein
MPIIAVNQPASGLDIYLRFNGILTDPLSISYNIKEPNLVTVASGNGFKRSVGHYDARNSTIPSGYDTTSSWQIAWTFVSPGGVTSTATEEFTVTAALVSAFTNIDNVIEIIKTNMGLDTEYTQTEYETFISKALRRLNRRLFFTGTTSVLSISSSTGSITPTPNDTIFDLIILQSECLISKNIRRQAVSKGIRVRDGDSEIDTTAGFSGHSDVVKDFCGELEDAIKDYLVNHDGAGQHGDMIGYADQEIYEVLDHNGDAYNERELSSPFDEVY